LRFNSQSSHTKDFKIGYLSTQLGTPLESEMDGTRGLSSRAGYAMQIP